LTKKTVNGAIKDVLEPNLSFKELLKARKFKWKTIVNEAGSVRYETQEVTNSEYLD
jgi:hypothetical protein